MSNYINFAVITDTPGRLKDFLISRGVIEEYTYTDPSTGQPNTGLRGTRPGMEWIRVPNPIVTDPGSGPGVSPYIPPTYDDRAVFLVKFAHESLANEDDGTPKIDGEGNPVDVYDWSRFGKWVRNNSTVVAAPVNYTIAGEPVGNALKINGQQVWLVRERPERFGVWQ